MFQLHMELLNWVHGHRFRIMYLGEKIGFARSEIVVNFTTI